MKPLARSHRHAEMPVHPLSASPISKDTDPLYFESLAEYDDWIVSKRVLDPGRRPVELKEVPRKEGKRKLHVGDLTFPRKSSLTMLF